MAANADKDLAEHLETIRADIVSLTKTVSQLATDTAGIQASLRQRVSSAAKSAVGVGEEILNEAEKLGGQAIHATARGASAAVDAVETQIKRNPLIVVLIALGFGVSIGLFSRK
jgi:ElaB/YqjD/DUF883 family membrane-anchored ribosome-binding protein